MLYAVSGNYPLADVIVVNRDENTGDVISIDGISLKSQRGKEQQPLVICFRVL